MAKTAKFDSDDLIYNRFDLIYGTESTAYHYSGADEDYVIRAHYHKTEATLDIWGKTFPPEIFHKAVSDIFSDSAVCSINVVRGGNPYQDFLETTNDIRVPLPDSAEELLARVERRDRATIQRKKRWLNERIGNLEMKIFTEKIPDEIVDLYFQWKKTTHGTDYRLQPQEYIGKYHVTDALLLQAGETPVAVALFCQVNKIVFFENFSYNIELKKYSPGLLMYEMFMEELIKRGCKYLYLGGGSYIYKKRFGAEEKTAYSGIIYRPEIMDGINRFFADRQIKTLAIYGLGVCGNSFLNLKKKLEIEVCYGIDKNSKEDSPIPVYHPDDNANATDAALITLNNKDISVEKLLKERYPQVYYWNDILESVVEEYRKGEIQSRAGHPYNGK